MKGVRPLFVYESDSYTNNGLTPWFSLPCGGFLSIEGSVHEESLSESLNKLLATEGGHAISLGEILDRVGPKGFGLLLMVLSLPSALPIPAAGYSTPFGVIFVFLGVQMLTGRREPWLPGWARRLTFKASLAEKMIQGAAKAFSFLEHLVKPRLEWVAGRSGMAIMSLLVMTMACLMILPIPLTNTAPAGVIFLIGVSICERDGLFAIAATALGVVAVAFYAFVIYIAITAGVEGVEHLKDWIKDILPG
ncbi:MAG: exopolysaccharide biosynthesis protein [Verrucomicrobia bacterium]|nr:MAG: exopolysaccharide biosynthesis protein [Verrucomicrobiota bacterium]